jgi:hypothetical protein
MKVFISWSGAKSKTVAAALRQWIPDVIQTVEPWMSTTDIDAGARWNRDIDKELGETKFGIICLTKTNHSSPWILFEAGALAKTIEDTFVCPYLIDIVPSEIPRGPLTQFQAKRADEKETWELIATINKALKEGFLPEERLRRTFERCWPDLKSTLANLPPEQNTEETQRPVENMVEEILDLVRGLSRRPSIESKQTSFALPKRGSSISTRLLLANRDGYKCKICGTEANLEIVHIIPISKGGTNDIENLQLLCAKHNLEKSNAVEESD